uniref:Uncharacterized protein n=1 Tax=viral metagenome TaxID=1070528 RepID=A0A6H1ZKI9_9ZZZZ
MKAEDTVQKVGVHTESIWCSHCGEEFGIEDKVLSERQTQAEVSFKAGMKEVAEWIEQAYIYPLTKQAGLIQVRDLEVDLKFKRKEWGLIKGVN